MEVSGQLHLLHLYLCVKTPVPTELEVGVPQKQYELDDKEKFLLPP
jgi:hypothetical protein